LSLPPSSTHSSHSMTEELKTTDTAAVFDEEQPFDRVSLTLHWESGVDLSPLFPDSPSFFKALRQALTASIIAEKKRAFGVEVLLYEEEDRRQADELAGILIKQYRVAYEGGRCRVRFGGLEEDVGEWLCEVVNSLN
jgi:hypothetical protein